MPKRKGEILFLPGIDWSETGNAALAAEQGDAGQRAAALNTARSFIVQAPAGSGKTGILIQRYLALLGRVAEPEAIVAITFTVKAAAEMRARVLKALASAAAGVEPEKAHERTTFQLACAASERDRRLGWGLRENPGRMRVQTIDALCAAIARQMPWTARLGAMPDVTEDAEEFYREAAVRTAALLDDPDPVISGAVETLLLHLENDVAAAEALIAKMLAQRDQWLRIVGAGGLPSAQVRAKLEAALARAVSEGLGRARAAMPEWAAVELAASAQHASRFTGAGHDFRCMPGTGAECLPAWQWLADLVLTKNGEWRKGQDKRYGFAPGSREKKAINDVLEALAGSKELEEALCAVQKLPPPHFDESQWRVMEAAFTVLPRSVAELRVVFELRGTVDFAEIALRSQDALGQSGEPTDLALAMGARMEHLLVDEFQDTSELQFELLRRLTAGWEQGDGRTLFLVGDPMQSIYRFRQAEVGLFLDARAVGVGALRLDPLSLSANFRSERGVVEWVNEAFARVFPTVEQIEAGAVAYSASEPVEPAGSGDAVTIYPLFGRDDDHEADVAFRAIEAARSENPDGTIAVLVGARTHLIGLAERLREAGVPFRAVEIETLAERPAVQDLLALTRALLDRGDRVSWLAILRAPWCGLTLADLHALAAADRYAVTTELLDRRAEYLSEDGQARLSRVLPTILDALSKAGRVPLRGLVESTWVALGGPQCLPDEASLEDALTYLELLETSEKGGDLPSLDLFGERVERLFAKPDPTAGGKLQLMTIHKAKGLEFDTVVVPGLGRSTRRDEPSLLVWVERAGPDGSTELLMSAAPRRGREDAVCKFVTRIEREKCDHESARLLYVACTRAKKRLHLIGATAISKKDGTMCDPESGSLLQRLWPAVRDVYAAEFEARGRVENDGEGSTRPKRPGMIRRLPAGWVPPPLPEAVKFEGGTATTQTASARAAYAGVDAVFRAAGTVVHRVLEQIGREGLPAWNEGRVRGLRAVLRNMLVASGVPQQQTGAALARVEETLCRALSGERGRFVLGAHAEAESEAAIGGVIDGVVYHASIDRTFVDEAGVRWIIDYKTGAPAQGERAEHFLRAEAGKYADQLERYARLFAQLGASEIMLGLYYPLFDGWIEWRAGSQSFSTRFETSTARTP